MSTFLGLLTFCYLLSIIGFTQASGNYRSRLVTKLKRHSFANQIKKLSLLAYTEFCHWVPVSRFLPQLKSQRTFWPLLSLRDVLVIEFSYPTHSFMPYTSKLVYWLGLGPIWYRLSRGRDRKTYERETQCEPWGVLFAIHLIYLNTL